MTNDQKPPANEQVSDVAVPYVKYLAGAVRKYLKSKSFTPDQFAKQVGYPVEVIFDILEQRRSFYVTELVDLADAMGLKAWQMMKDAEEGKQP